MIKTAKAKSDGELLVRWLSAKAKRVCNEEPFMKIYVEREDCDEGEDGESTTTWDILVDFCGEEVYLDSPKELERWLEDFADSTAYATRDRETGTIIDYFESLENARFAIERYEEKDKEDGTYEPDFYEIAKKDENGNYITVDD